MALTTAWTFLLRNASLLRQSGFIAFLQIRTKTHHRSSVEVKAYEKFRREITLARKKFQDEWKEQQQMKTEGVDAQAAKEARLEREREERALEENQREVERMKTERERANALFQQQREEQFMRGKQVRQQMEERNTDQRAKVVQKLEDQSYGFITMDNLDEKIQEAIDYEVDYNFALTTDGKKSNHRD